MSFVFKWLMTRCQTFVQLFSCSSYVARKLMMSLPAIDSLILDAKAPLQRIIVAVASDF